MFEKKNSTPIPNIFGSWKQSLGLFLNPTLNFETCRKIGRNGEYNCFIFIRKMFGIPIDFDQIIFQSSGPLGMGRIETEECTKAHTIGMASRLEFCYLACFYKQITKP